MWKELLLYMLYCKKKIIYTTTNLTGNWNTRRTVELKKGLKTSQGTIWMYNPSNSRTY